MLALDLAGIKRNDVVFVVRFPPWQRQQTIIQALMRSALKIIGNVLGNNVVEVRFAEDQEVVESFLFCRLYPAFDIGIQIWCLGPNRLYLYPFVLEHLVEFFRKGAVMVPYENLAGNPLHGGVIQKYTCLMFHPATVGRLCSRRDEHTPRSQVDKSQDKHLPRAKTGPDAFTEKVALPQSLRVDMQEFTPSPTSAPWPRIKVIFFENILDGLSRDMSCSQFFNSPSIRPYPQPVSRAMRATNSRMLMEIRGRPVFTAVLPSSALRTQRRNVE